MIVFYAQGGLGNQLFQYAAARRLAVRHRCALVLDPSWFNRSSSRETPRPLELARYPVAMRVADDSERRRWRSMRCRLARHVRPFLPLRLLREQGDGVNQAVLDAPQDSYLFGFWQSEAYFSDIRELLLEDLTPTQPPSDSDRHLIDLICTSNAVSVHVRRGDYVTLASAAAYHGLCPLEYYDAAIRHVSAHVDNPTLFVFSDDPEWTRAHLLTPFPTHYVDHNGPGNAFQDLRLMSACRHHVLANSSFSWWGAWLSESQDGVVVAPARWYAADRATPDLIPARWTRI